jgi:beta-1,4-mannosyl-glycoprotein beta-1,4-N-acetylglucosaminyltransferase
MFSHELDLLEIRFGILENSVDYFVITESDTTFSGKDKPLFFKENIDRFDRWKDKIIYNRIDIPNYENPWDREAYSRNAALYATDYDDDDIIMSSDADEIPRPEVVINIPSMVIDSNTYATLKQSMYIYYLNNFETNEWYGTRAIAYKNMTGRSLQNIREYTESPTGNDGLIIQNAGWHFTSCGGADSVRRKIESFSHSELNRTDIIDNIENNIKTNGDLYYRDKKYSYVPIDESFPQYLRNNMDKYDHLIYKLS